MIKVKRSFALILVTLGFRPIWVDDHWFCLELGFEESKILESYILALEDDSFDLEIPIKRFLRVQKLSEDLRLKKCRANIQTHFSEFTDALTPPDLHYVR